MCIRDSCLYNWLHLDWIGYMEFHLHTLAGSKHNITYHNITFHNITCHNITYHSITYHNITTTTTTTKLRKK